MRAAILFLVFCGWAAAGSVEEIQKLIQNGDVRRAGEMAEQAVRDDPNNVVVWNILGILRGQGGDYSGAEKAFHQAIALDAKLPTVWLNLGRLYQLNIETDPQALEKGISAYTTVLQLDPQNAEANHQMGLLLAWKGQFRESLAHLDRLPPADQNRRSALVLRCADLAALGDSKGAQESAAVLLRDPDLQEAEVLAILPVVEKYDPATAEKLLDGIAQRGLASKESMAHLAALREKRGELARARDSYEKLAQQSPAKVAPLIDLARTAFRQKDFEGALGYLGHARDLEPNNAAIHFFFGVTCNELRLPVDAKKSLEKAVELAPDNPYYSYALGAIELQFSDTSPAVPHLAKYVAAHPEDPRGHLALGTAWYYNNEFGKARKELNAAAPSPQTRAGAQYLLGLISRRDDQVDEAVMHLTKAAAADRSVAGPHAELALIYCDRREWPQARKEAETALKLDPDSFKANQAMMRIYREEKDPRTAEQAKRLEAIAHNRDEKLNLLLRTVEVRPF